MKRLVKHTIETAESFYSGEPRIRMLEVIRRCVVASISEKLSDDCINFIAQAIQHKIYSDDNRYIICHHINYKTEAGAVNDDPSNIAFVTRAAHSALHHKVFYMALYRWVTKILHRRIKFDSVKSEMQAWRLLFAQDGWGECKFIQWSSTLNNLPYDKLAQELSALSVKNFFEYKYINNGLLGYVGELTPAVEFIIRQIDEHDLVYLDKQVVNEFVNYVKLKTGSDFETSTDSDLDEESRTAVLDFMNNIVPRFKESDPTLYSGLKYVQDLLEDR